MTEPDFSTTSNDKQSLTSLLLQIFARAMRQAFGRRVGMPAQADADAQIKTEAELQARYASAVHQRLELERRAQAHGITFALIARAHHRAALLDFLDNPTALTPLNTMHMTWVSAIDPSTGGTTVSGTHAAIRAIHDWSAQHFAAMTPRNAHDSPVLDRLRAMTPLNRVGWTAEQWRAHEAQETERWPAGFNVRCDAPAVIANRRASRDHRLGV